jgi:hypothetical protein
MRARAEVFERNIYSAAPHAAQRRRHARGACKGQVQLQHMLWVVYGCQSKYMVALIFRGKCHSISHPLQYIIATA